MSDEPILYFIKDCFDCLPIDDENDMKTTRVFILFLRPDPPLSLDYMHHANPKTPIEDTMRALAELQA